VTYALFDDAGKFFAGRVMSEADTAMQVELDSGKRVKVKNANVMLRFTQPEPAALMARAHALAQEIDLDLAWEFAPPEDFGFADFAREYFDAKATAEQQAAALLRLFDAPHYFRRLGRGVFRKAPEETVKAALLAIERKRAVQEQIDAWAVELAAGRCPPPVREQLYRILFRPDKNAPEYKAVVQASRSAQRAPLDLLKAAGAIDSAYQFHWRRFLFEQFPRGFAHPSLPVPAVKEALPLSDAQAFSIDDSATTEIDDALSVSGLGSGQIRFGIHIAAPGLAITADSALDKLARDRLSTVYMPGYKITMLPDEVVSAFTLAEGRECAALSLYVSFDEATLDVLASETRIDRVMIAANLRHDVLDEHVTEATLRGEAGAEASYPFAPELAFAFRLAEHLKGLREVVRGKPEVFNRPDYNFKLVGNDEKRSPQAALPPPPEGVSQLGSGPSLTHEPDGSETVQITTRRRGAPLDLIVSEAMILANSTWGGWIAECGVPAIYRSQASLSPGIKVRMGARPLPHAGMGVPQYAWATSPLRRYVDLVNQWQIIACARHGRTAALAAPFKPRDATLFSVISAFDAAYSAYNDFQNGIERYWTLRWLQQQEAAEITAGVLKDGLVRADNLPLVFKAVGCEALPRGTRVKLRITGIDTLTLDLHASLVARIDDAPPAAAADDTAETSEDEPVEAGPLALAIDTAEESAAPSAVAAEPPAA
jgi:exoribonuclease II